MSQLRFTRMYMRVQESRAFSRDELIYIYFYTHAYAHVYTYMVEYTSTNDLSLPCCFSFSLARKEPDRDWRLLTLCLYVAIRANRSYGKMRHNIEPRRVHKYSFVWGRVRSLDFHRHPSRLRYAYTDGGSNMRICAHNQPAVISCRLYLLRRPSFQV